MSIKALSQIDNQTARAFGTKTPFCAFLVYNSSTSMSTPTDGTFRFNSSNVFAVSQMAISLDAYPIPDTTSITYTLSNLMNFANYPIIKTFLIIRSVSNPLKYFKVEVLDYEIRSFYHWFSIDLFNPSFSLVNGEMYSVTIIHEPGPSTGTTVPVDWSATTSYADVTASTIRLVTSGVYQLEVQGTVTNNNTSADMQIRILASGGTILSSYTMDKNTAGSSNVNSLSQVYTVDWKSAGENLFHIGGLIRIATTTGVELRLNARKTTAFSNVDIKAGTIFKANAV